MIVDLGGWQSSYRSKVFVVYGNACYIQPHALNYTQPTFFNNMADAAHHARATRVTFVGLNLVEAKFLPTCNSQHLCPTSVLSSKLGAWIFALGIVSYSAFPQFTAIGSDRDRQD